MHAAVTLQALDTELIVVVENKNPFPTLFGIDIYRLMSSWLTWGFTVVTLVAGWIVTGGPVSSIHLGLQLTR